MTVSASLQFAEFMLAHCLFGTPFPYRLQWYKSPMRGYAKKSLNGGRLIPYLGQMMQ